MKKGFTLIELLAVIIILAIIALIATPLIISIINDSRQSAALESARGYVKAVNYKIIEEELKGNITPDGEYVIGENELIVSAKNIDNITGEYLINENNVAWAGLCVNHYSIGYYNGNAFLDRAANYCNEEQPYVFTEPEGELISSICESSSGDSIYNDNTYFKIKTVEDLACLSNLVSSGKNFHRKTIYLLSDIDFNSDSSYKNKATTVYGDINGNGSAEGLKVEVTTEKGFKPIGNGSNAFYGTFQGYAFTISNLMINRPNESYVGLFGLNEGTITGVRVQNANVKGYNDTAVLVGHNRTTTISNLDVQGSVEGNNNVGGIMGYSEAQNKYPWVYSNANYFVFKGSVKGNSTVGGAIGYNNYSYNTYNGLVYDTTITATGTNVGKAIGTNVSKNIAVSNVTLNSSDTSGYNGKQSNTLNMLIFDGVLDTYIGGDNDNDKYYFDYDSNSVLTLYSTERKPIQINKLKGEGTEENPYIIKNTADWKMATSTIYNTTKYYSVINNISFTGKNYYPMGTSANQFKGIIDGNGHTISNVSLEGHGSVGLVGENRGTIKNFKFDNITISSTAATAGIIAGNYGPVTNTYYNNVTITSQSENTGLIGYNVGSVNGMKGRNITVTGQNDTGGAIGQNVTTTIKNIDVRGTVVGADSVGGIMGYSEAQNKTPWVYSNANYFVFKGSVTGNNNVGGAIGYNNYSYNTYNGLVYDTTITATGTNVGKAIGTNVSKNIAVSNVTLNSSDTSGYHGKQSNTLNMLIFDGVLDTYIGGDNDNDNMYFDYNSDGEIELYSVTDRPITNTLSGSGTESDPYIIANTDDWKVATSTIYNTTKYYSVTNDLNFNGKNYYSMGTSANQFKGIIDGNGHTISNVSLEGHGYVGLSGVNRGTIKNFTFNNITISSTAASAGIIGENYGPVTNTYYNNITVTSQSENTGLIGYNQGSVNGMKARSVSITGQNDTGGAIGQNVTTTIKNIDIRGTVVGVNNVGGIIGYSEAQNKTPWVYSNANYFVFKGNITGNNFVGGAIGNNNYSYNAYNGVVYDTQITATGTNVGKAIGNYFEKNIAVSNVTLNSSDTSGYHGKQSNTLNMLIFDGVLDTYIGGDNDSDNMYFDYNSNGEIEVYSKLDRPLTNTLSGAGTESNPYIIASTDDWKVATSTIDNTTKYYSVTSDLDFTSKNYYPMGTNANPFKGVINGNNHIVSNVSLEGHGSVGIVGENRGTIKNFTFNNITISSTGATAGVIANNSGTLNNTYYNNITVTSQSENVGLIGINQGSVNGMKGRNIIVTGQNDTGGAVGELYISTIKNIDVQANVTGTNYVGGIAGRAIAENKYPWVYGNVYDFVFKGSVTGTNYVGGAIGQSNNSSNYFNGVVYNSTITSTDTYGGKALGGGSKRGTQMVSSSTTKSDASTSGIDGTEFTDITLEAVNGALDTTIGGDNGNDGFYFTLTNGEYELIPAN